GVAIQEPDEADEEYRALVVERLAERDEALLATYVDSGSVPWTLLRRSIATQSRRGDIHPVFMGSAGTGVGVEALLAAIPVYLPEAIGDPDAQLRGRVFKIER